MRGKRKIAACILVCILAVTACGPEQGGAAQTENGTIAAASGDPEDVTLTVYCQDDIALFVNALREYKQLYDVDVNLELFENVEEMESRITTEALSGGGPDVYLFSTDGNSLDIQKMMKNGSFYALDELMEEEKSYKGYQEENYYSCMIEAGQYGGKQYILPLSFNMVQFYADSSLMDTYYPALQEGYDMEEFLQVLKEECSRAEGLADYTGILWAGTGTNVLSMLLEQSQAEIIDYEAKQVMLDMDMLENMAEFWQKFLKTEKISEIVQKFNGQQELLEHFTFMSDRTSMLNAVRHNVSLYGLSNIKPNVYILPSWEQENNYTATICEFGGVNANSSYPSEAYSLLRSIMDFQMEYDFNKYQTNISYYLPVNKNILHSCLQNVVQQRGKGKFTIYPLTEEYEEQLENILENINAAVIPNPKVGSIIDEVMDPYFSGEEEFDTCYLKLENRLKLYLSE